MKPNSVQQTKRRLISGINVRSDLVNWKPHEESTDDRIKGFAGEAPSPIVGVKHETDFRQPPAPGLADDLSFKFEHEIVADQRVSINHATKPVSCLIQRSVRRSRPIAHGLGVAQDSMHRQQILPMGAPENKPFGLQDNHPADLRPGRSERNPASLRKWLNISPQRAFNRKGVRPQSAMAGTFYFWLHSWRSCP